MNESDTRSLNQIRRETEQTRAALTTTVEELRGTGQRYRRRHQEPAAAGCHQGGGVGIHKEPRRAALSRHD